ncbi:hypothetical protein LT318_00172 [Spiroplasma sp. JKS002670]|nr:hypothetical protein [Spiroplasma sp. JKS002670]
MLEQKNEINFAIPESTRPPMYKALKYWGKKPHNIWAEYIKTYTKKSDIILDPFAGSGIAALEAVILGRKSMIFDLNPLTAFIIEVFATEFDEKIYISKINDICNKVLNTEEYKKYFYTFCTDCEKESEVICFRWDNEHNEIYEIGYVCKCLEGISKKRKKPDKFDFEKSNFTNLLLDNKFIPQDKFPNTKAFSDLFIKKMNSIFFKDLWTKRNLFVLSLIFKEIITDKKSSYSLKLQLLFAFIQCLHLTTKMCIPRDSDAADRYFSTSWGRSAYLLSSKSFEANALIWFKSSSLGKQSAESALINFKSRLSGRQIKIEELTFSNRKSYSKNSDIIYGIIDAEAIDEYIKPNSIDFIITDPPYGDLVQYISLSLVWLNWLKMFNKKYEPDLRNELIIDKNMGKDELFFNRKLTSILIKLNILLKDKSKFILTFHSKDINMWNIINKSINDSDFIVEKSIWQQNLRTGESNVANPFGTSASDIYMRLIKNKNINLLNNQEKYENLVIKKAIEIIAKRNEPTPFDLLYNGILSELSKTGYNIDNYNMQVQKILEKKINKIFIIEKNDGFGGSFWWFQNPEKYIINRTLPLSNRVKVTIENFLIKNGPSTFDEIIKEVFINFPNGLTPAIKSVKSVLEEIAYKGKKSGSSKWYIEQANKVNGSIHSEKIYKLLVMGNNYNYFTGVGKRESSDLWNGQKLKVFAKEINNYSNKFIDMIDVIWIKEDKNEKKIEAIFEVENSTEFIKSIDRSSSLSSIPKFMIIPDYRETELKKNSNILFKDSFEKYNWRYIIYSDFENIFKFLNSKKNQIFDPIEIFKKYARRI